MGFYLCLFASLVSLSLSLNRFLGGHSPTLEQQAELPLTLGIGVPENAA